MFRKLTKDAPVKNVLIVNMSNIGDVLLSAPAMDIMMRDFPDASFSIVVGERAASLFHGNTRFKKVYIWDKRANFKERMSWLNDIKQGNYDTVIDFRHSAIGFYLMPRYVTPLSFGIDKRPHLKDRHLNRLRTLYTFDPQPNPPISICPSPSEEGLIDQLLKNFMNPGDPFVAIAPVAADYKKTWAKENFAPVANAIGKKYGYKIILLGSQKDTDTLAYIANRIEVPHLVLAGRTTLLEAGALLKRARFVIVHDSGPMHIASYYNKPVIALFGPTDPERSRPWSDHYEVVHKNTQCFPCQNPSSQEAHTCMTSISPNDVMGAVDKLNARI